MRRFMSDYGLCEYDAKILVGTKKDAQFAEECIRKYPGKIKRPWLTG
jgi:Asp-tRNA(Asn)/Glu-tRNA(Gln) amidotransferase B subunit